MIVAVDNIDANLSFTQTPPPGTLMLGDPLIGFNAGDDSDNVASCLVNVIYIDDIEPTISCPSPQVVQALAGEVQTFVTVQVPTVHDNCGIFDVSNSLTLSNNISGVYPQGTTYVTYNVTDSFGNHAECSTSITVLSGQNCCLGDFDCNGIVNVTDLSYLLTEFGCLNSCLTDINEDGVVGVSDQAMFMSLYGLVCP